MSSQIRSTPQALVKVLGLAVITALIMPRVVISADQHGAGKASAAVQARLNAAQQAAKQPAPFVEGRDQEPQQEEGEQGLTFYLTDKAAAENFTEIRSLLEKAGAEAYGFSREGSFFHASSVSGMLLEQVHARPDIIFIEEAAQRTGGSEYLPFNLDAQDTHEIEQLRSRHLVSGSGVTAGIWDGGTALASHIEFAGRVMEKDKAVPGAHATHVTGTIAATGKNSAAQGMAPGAAVHSYDWLDDIDEMAISVTEGVVVTNHSYGFVRGWIFNEGQKRWEWHGDPGQSETEDYLFGKYTGVSSSFDRVTYDAPTLSVFTAAGNDRNDDPRVDAAWNGLHYVPSISKWSIKARFADGFDAGGFDTLGGASLAKNVITVGAIEDITTHEPTPNDIRVTGFSCWGPPDDGRVKPDIVANGAYLLSPTVKTKLDGTYYTDRYTSLSGTSMASPVASGVATLLNELAKRKLGRTLYSDEVKALLIHTALSPNAGPSYQIGWGSIRADWAGDVLNGERGTLKRETLGTAVVSAPYHAEKGRPIRVTLVWLDPPGHPNPAGIDDRSSSLVHDLDLTLKDPDGTIHYPWSLDPNHPQNSATRTGPNRVDNVERVDVQGQTVKAGVWTMSVSIPAGVGRKDYALVISGLDEISGN